ncbi:MAG: pilus assembly protein N-terminal domain-containing protein, partial [Pseudomonadota bacterium]
MRIVLLGMVLALAAGQAALARDAVNNTMLVRIQKGGESHLSERVVLPLNKAAIIELPVEARDVLVSNPEIVDAVIRSAKRTYILGMQVGQTNAFFFDSQGRQILNLEIRVERDLSPLTEMLSKFLPDARFDVEALNDNIVLRGTVPNAVKAQQASDIAARFVGDPEKVMNMVSIMGNEQVLLQVRVVEMKRTLIKTSCYLTRNAPRLKRAQRASAISLLNSRVSATRCWLG